MLTLLQAAEQNLGDLSLAPEAVWSSLCHLKREDLSSLYLPYVELNLRSLLAGQMDEAALRASAVEGVRYLLYQGWVYRAYLNKSPEERDQLFPIDVGSLGNIGEVLPVGRGAVVCSYHLREYRFLPNALATAGWDVLATMDARTFGELNPLLVSARETVHRDENARGTNRGLGRLRFCSVEDRSAAREMIRHVKEGGVLLIYLDGNTGAGGTHSHGSRCIVDFGPLKLGVRTGAARIAAVAGVPLYLILVDHNSTGQSVVAPKQVSYPDKARDGDGFVENAIREMWHRFYNSVRGAEHLWESLRFCHRLRGDVVCPDTSDCNADLPPWTPSERITLSPFVQKIPLPDGFAWMHARTLRGYSHQTKESQILSLLEKLGSASGVQLSHLAELSEEDTKEMWQALLASNLAEIPRSAIS